MGRHFGGGIGDQHRFALILLNSRFASSIPSIFFRTLVADEKSRLNGLPHGLHSIHGTLGPFNPRGWPRKGELSVKMSLFTGHPSDNRTRSIPTTTRPIYRQLVGNGVCGPSMQNACKTSRFTGVYINRGDRI